MADTNEVKAYIVETSSNSPSSILSKEFSSRRVLEKIEEESLLVKKYKKAKRKKEEKKELTEDEAALLREVEDTDGAILPESQQIKEKAFGEYLAKPYKQEYLASLIDMNQRLQSCIVACATNSIKLGLDLKPYLYPFREMSDLDVDQKAVFKEQSMSLVSWLKRISKRGIPYIDLFYETVLALVGLGEAYLEVVEDSQGRLDHINFCDPRYIWIGKDKDRYIQIYRGKKVYFRPFFEKNPVPRFAKDFKTAEEAKVNGIPIEKQATKLIHLRNPNLISSIYGVPNWVPSVPSILGNRSADERDKAFFDNDACPRMALLISGGHLGDSVVETMKKFFRENHKGVEKAHRVLIVEASGANTSRPNWKPPTMEFKPLTVGDTDDASFLKYRKYTNTQVLEAFRISKIFLGLSEDINRAAAFTMREMTVNLVFSVIGQTFARTLNETILPRWMEEEAKLSEEDTLVQFGFRVPKTISQKDQAEIIRYYAAAGAYTPNDIREIEGLDPFDEAWGDIPAALTIVFAQMGFVNTPSPGELAGDSDTAGEKTDQRRLQESLLLLSRVLKPYLRENPKAMETFLSNNLGILTEKAGMDEEETQDLLDAGVQ